MDDFLQIEARGCWRYRHFVQSDVQSFVFSFQNRQNTVIHCRYCPSSVQMAIALTLVLTHPFIENSVPDPSEVNGF